MVGELRGFPNPAKQLVRKRIGETMNRVQYVRIPRVPMRKTVQVQISRAEKSKKVLATRKARAIHNSRGKR